LRARISLFIAIVQSILLLVHLALYGTWAFFFAPLDSSRRIELRIALAILCFSFVAASLLARQSSNWLVRAAYSAAAVWLGLVNFLFLAACLCWAIYLPALLFGMRLDRRLLAFPVFGLALLLAVYSVFHAARTRVKRITIRLPNLPSSWRGRTAAVVSDLHLGHIRNRSFLRRIVRMLARLQPDILFVPGDLFDGTKLDEQRISEPWAAFSAPLGSYFVTGNHEQFSSPDQYLAVARKSGFRVLENEKVDVDGLQLVGVHYLHSTHPEHFRSILKNVGLDPTVASILLVHTPDRMSISAQEGISLQLSGHTHRGQFFPFTLAVKRVYRQYAYGLNSFENLLIYTSCGAGTWGPPMRLGTTPEIVLIRFE
jgi:predicted MPP superfamily phosphohydrolase